MKKVITVCDICGTEITNETTKLFPKQSFDGFINCKGKKVDYYLALNQDKKSVIKEVCMDCWGFFETKKKKCAKVIKDSEYTFENGTKFKDK